MDRLLSRVFDVCLNYRLGQRSIMMKDMFLFLSFVFAFIVIIYMITVIDFRY